MMINQRFPIIDREPKAIEVLEEPLDLIDSFLI